MNRERVENVGMACALYGGVAFLLLAFAEGGAQTWYGESDPGTAFRVAQAVTGVVAFVGFVIQWAAKRFGDAA